jgi:hypothetical protein
MYKRINDVRDPSKRIPAELLPYFEIKELMGPVELILTYKEAFA